MRDKALQAWSSVPHALASTLQALAWLPLLPLPQPPSGGSLCSWDAPGSAFPLEWVVQLAKLLVTDSLGQELRDSYWWRCKLI